MPAPYESIVGGSADQCVVEIRPAVIGDLNALVEICRLSFPGSLRWQGPRRIAARLWRRWLSSGSCRCWVCSRGMEVLGFVVFILDCDRYRAEAETRAVTSLDSAVLLMWHPLLAIKKAISKLSLYRATPQSVSVRKDMPNVLQKCTWIELIAVRPDVQGRGLGAMMLEHCATVTRTLGCEMVKLKVNKDNVQAFRAYERVGFEVTAEDADAYTYTYLLK